MQEIDKNKTEQCADEIIKSMNLLKAKGTVVEVRILKTNKGTISGCYDDFVKMADDVKPYNGKYNIYFTINPVKQELLARSKNRLQEYAQTTTADADIDKRSILMIDFDAKRSAGISSSDEEHAKAIEKAEQVKIFLTEQSWVEPVVADSGNGAHLLYPIDLPNDKESTELVHNVLKALDAMFTDVAVEIDKTTFNASRICKLYGTIACKGEDTEERPHRFSKILSHPDEINIATKEQLASIASMLPVEEKKTTKKNQPKIDIIKWMAEHGMEVFKDKSLGNATLYVLDKCPWREEHNNHSAYIIQFDNGALSAGCHHNSCSNENWHTLRDKLEPDRNKKSAVKEKGDENKESQSAILINAGCDIKLFHDELEVKYAAVIVNGHSEVYLITGEKFKQWLTKSFYDETKQAPNKESMSQALGVFEMKAMYEGELKNFSKRCAKHEDKYYYDLVDDKWRTIEIGQDGWKVVDDAPILFIRSKNMLAQVLPEKYEDLTILNKHYRFKNADDEILHMVDIVTKFIPDIGHPIDVIYGEKGSSKTTSMRKDKKLVDPASAHTLALPTSREELALLLNNNYMPCFDNLDNITTEKSDMLCMAATGGAFIKRTLYSNDEETILSFKRPVSLNGINVVATKPDLLDRSVLLELDRIPADERKDENDIWKEFEADKPKILGAIFTTLSKAMSIYDNVKLDRMGRMADFTKWGYAIAEAAGIGGEKFLDSYINNQSRANVEAVESNPVAAAVIKLMAGTPKWDGTVTNLLRELNKIAINENINTRSKLWATESNVLSRRLKEVKSNLELIGIHYTIRHHSNAKEITITNRLPSTEITVQTDNDDTKNKKVIPYNRELFKNLLQNSSPEITIVDSMDDL